MCGIVGLVALDGPLDPRLRAALPNMAHALRHRGPDGDGFWADAHAALAHRRLAIIDLEGGRQPLANEDESCWITFNGEIYNHHELREQLVARGHRFRTRSDTEVIVHAYEEFGTSCVDRLEGMFAFAIYDRTKRELFAARDRLGKKPFFYAVLEGVLHFASEMKGIRESPAWDGSLDYDQLEGYLSLGYFLAPGTVYRHVRKLEPGHWLRLRQSHIEVRQYWDVTRFDDWTGSEDEAVATIEQELGARVRERLESEVPLGAFLSGGIDSGLVVSLMAEHHRGAVVTTSVGSNDPDHNELDLAGTTARRYSTVHHAHIITPDMHEVIDDVVGAFDEPFADASSVPTWYVSREARRHVTVALSGDGGDESFGGYDFRYVPHAWEGRARALLGTPLRRAFGRAGAAWPRSNALPRPLRLGTYLENVGRDPEAAYYADLCFLKPDRARMLMGRAPDRDPRDSPVYEAVTSPYVRCPSASPVQRAEYADLKIYLANDVLVKVDRMSMQHSLEVRCPLLDRRIVELAFRIPQELKQADRRGKHLLKQLAVRRLPSEVVARPKQGFTVPIGAWLAGPLSARFEADVLNTRANINGLIDLAYVRRAFHEHRNSHADHQYLLWAVWALERWSTDQRRNSSVPSPQAPEVPA